MYMYMHSQGFIQGFLLGGGKLFGKANVLVGGVWGHSGQGSFRKIIVAHVMPAWGIWEYGPPEMF